MNQQRNNLIGILGLSTILIINSAFLYFNAFRCFNLFDMGSMLDACWRVTCGQKPYIDFLYHTGPLHLYMTAFFFWIFGFGKPAILIHLFLVNGLAVTATYLIARRFTSVYIALLTALLSAASFYFPVSHPWYDHSAHIWGILAVWLIAFHIPMKQSRNIFWIGFFSGVMAVLALMAKTNVGLAYGLIFLIFWILNSERKKGLGGYFLGGIVATLGMFILIQSPGTYLDQTVFNWGANQHFRLKVFQSLSTWFPKSYWLIMTIVAVNVWKNFRKLSEFIILLIGLYFVALFVIHTSELGSANTPLRGIVMALAFILLYQNQKLDLKPWAKNLHRLSMAALVALSLIFAYRSVQFGLSLEVFLYGGYEMGDYPLKTKPFDGWFFEKKDGVMIDEMVDYINQNIPKDQSLLILENIQILYALSGRDSYRGIPFMFSDIGTKGKQLEEIQGRIYQKPPDWIIAMVKENSCSIKYTPLYLSQEFLSKYNCMRQWTHFAIFKRQK